MPHDKSLLHGAIAIVDCDATAMGAGAVLGRAKLPWRIFQLLHDYFQRLAEGAKVA